MQRVPHVHLESAMSPLAVLLRTWRAAGLLVLLALAACGAPQADEAAQRQLALAATVAAAPTSVATPVAAVLPTPPPVAAVLPTPPPTSAPAAQPSTSAPTSAVDRSPTETPAASATERALAQAPSTQAPPSATVPVPTQAPATQAPTAAPTQAPAPTDAPTRPAASDGRLYQIRFVDLYSGATITGPQVSELARSLDGRRVIMEGYMAPPLKPDLDFFVLTATPMVYCPFCSSAADWPFDIVFVRMAAGKTVPPMVPSQGIRVTGIFSVGEATDPGTGFVSMIRIIADDLQVAQ
jgi:hypothetical protein